MDIGSDKPVETVARQLAGVSERTRAPDPSLNVSVLGAGVGVGGVSRSWTTRYGREDLGALVLDVCSCEKHGLMLTIDEIQKVDLDDVSAILRRVSNGISQAIRRYARGARREETAQSRNLWARRRSATAGWEGGSSRLRRIACPRDKSPASSGAPPRAPATVSSGRVPGAHGCKNRASKVVEPQLVRSLVQVFMQP